MTTRSLESVNWRPDEATAKYSRFSLVQFTQEFEKLEFPMETKAKIVAGGLTPVVLASLEDYQLKAVSPRISDFDISYINLTLESLTKDKK